MCTSGYFPLASGSIGALTGAEQPRQPQFTEGDSVRLVDSRNVYRYYVSQRQNGTIVKVTSSRIVVDWYNGGRATNHVAKFLAKNSAVEPTTEGRSATQPEANK